VELLAAIFNLNHYGRYFTWHWLNISIANLVVVVLMVIVFVTALVAPFPGRAKRKGDQ